jgi:beta-glucanase (GH16 family)
MECFEDSPSNVWVSGGTLNLTAEQMPSSFLCPGEPPYCTQYTSGMVSTDKLFDQTDGLFEIRAKISAADTRGLQTSFWLYPASDDCVIGDPSQFHTYAVEWTAQSLTFMYDGQTCLVDHWNAASPLADPALFNEPFYLCLTQALGIATNDFIPGTTPLPARRPSTGSGSGGRRAEPLRRGPSGADNEGTTEERTSVGACAQPAGATNGPGGEH